MGSSCVGICKWQRSAVDTTKDGEKKCLCWLPQDVLLVLLSYLSVFDYLSFRAVCKCWRSAFSECSALVPHKLEHSRLPWFMIMKYEEFPEVTYVCPNYQRFLLKTTGKLGDLSSQQRIYNVEIPELCDKQMLLSRHGWLLLFSSKNGSSALFFLNPFSRARIDIPFIDVNELCFPMFDISAPPTSPDCVVFMVCYQAFRRIKISTCRRGESTWTTILPTGVSDTDPVVNTVFVNGIWYCLHDSGRFSAFDLVNSCYRFLGLPEGLHDFSESNIVSYVIKRGDDQVYLCMHGVTFFKVLLKEPLKVTRDPMSDIYWQHDVERLIRTEPERAFIQFQNELQVDSFNLPAWCGAFDTTENNNGTIAFRWHRFRSCINNIYYELDGRSCLRQNKGCRTIVAWIEPVWVHPSPALSWML